MNISCFHFIFKMGKCFFSKLKGNLIFRDVNIFVFMHILPTRMFLKIYSCTYNLKKIKIFLKEKCINFSARITQSQWEQHTKESPVSKNILELDKHLCSHIKLIDGGIDGVVVVRSNSSTVIAVTVCHSKEDSILDVKYFPVSSTKSLRM